jgi:hypothetical protein
MQESDSAPSSGDLVTDIRNMCCNNIYPDLIPFNNELAFFKEARRLGLGAPVTLELDKVAGYTAQGFSLGILYCLTGNWGNMIRLDW